MPAPPPVLEVLLPVARDSADARRILPDDGEPELSRLYAYPTREKVSLAGTGSAAPTVPGATSWVRASMISTVDGAGTGADGRSGSINGAADLRVFTVLRALADVILVGAGTVRAEGYRAPRTPETLLAGRRDRGQPDDPALAVVSASGDVPPALLSDDPVPWVFTVEDAPHLDRLRAALPADRLHPHPGTVDLPRVVDTLGTAGLTQVLTEGGPRLLGRLLEAGLVHELCVTTSPLLLGGSAPRIVAEAPWLDPPLDMEPAHLLHADGVLLGRWLVRRRTPSADRDSPPVR